MTNVASYILKIIAEKFSEMEDIRKACNSNSNCEKIYNFFRDKIYNFIKGILREKNFIEWIIYLSHLKSK